MSGDPYAALVPQGGGDPYSELVPQHGVMDTLKSAFHRVVNFVENPPAAQIVAKNRAAGKPQPSAFGSVAAAVPDEDQAAPAIAQSGPFRRAAGRSAIPTVAGAGGFGAGFAAGGTLTAPAEAIPVFGPAINLLGALGGGLAGAYGASSGAETVQDKAVTAMPVDVQRALGQDAETRRTDQQQHPIQSFAGSLAPMLLTMRPGFSAAPVAEDAPLLTRVLSHPLGGSAVGATFGGGQEAAREEVSGEGLDPEKIAIAAGAGAAMNRPTRLGSKLFQMGGNAATLGMQRGARAAGMAFAPANDAARQPFDVEATATPVNEPPAQLPPPQAEVETTPGASGPGRAGAPSGAPVASDPYQALVPTASPEPVVAPAPQVEPQPAIGASAAAEGGEAGSAGAPAAAPAPEGSQLVRTPAGTKVAVQPEVVDASTLNKATGDLQNRDRSRDTTALQVQDIISKFDPELLGNDPSSDRGAPIVHPDNTVLSGNGRMLAINQIYDQHPDKADAYRQFIESQGHSTEGIDRPVLIRRVAQDMTPEQARQFVIESNKDSKLELSPVEKARSDADNVTPAMLGRYAGGDLNSGANAGFVEAFTKGLTPGELGNVIGSDRRLTTTGIERIENAVVAKAYEHPKLLEKLMESPHNEIRAITSSLANVAPGWASMRESAKGGEIDGRYDITHDLADAAMRVAEARRAGTKPADILTQIDAFDRPSPITEKLIEAFYSPGMKRAASVKNVTELLRDYIDEANAQKSSDGLFGAEPGKEPVDILNGLLREREGGDTLFNFEPKENANVPGTNPSAREPQGAGTGRGHREADDRATPPALSKLEQDERAGAGGRTPAATEPDGTPSTGAPGEHGSGAGRGADRARQRDSRDGAAPAHEDATLPEHLLEEPAHGDTERTVSRHEEGREGQAGQGTGEAPQPQPHLAAEGAASSGNPGEPVRTGPEGGGRGSSDASGGGREPGLRAAPLEDRTPADDATPGGAYARSHVKGATTDRPSDLRSAVEHLGLAWDDFNLKAPPTQMRLLQGAIKDKLGIPVAVDHGPNGAHRGAIPYRVAIDQMLDAFHNITGMAAVLGLPPKAMSLNGTLSLELKKRANYYGAFYPGEEKIALPGRSNSFAHEWGHALDYYLMGELADGKGAGMSGLIRRKGSSVVSDPEIAERFKGLLNAMFFDKAAVATKIMELEAKVASAKSEATKAQFTRQIERIKQGAGQQRTGRTNYYKAAKSFDGTEGDYWQSPTEMLARSFEAYVAQKAAEAGMSTEVISHADADYLSSADERLASTFPKEEERQAIFSAYDDLFDALAQRQTLGSGEAAEIPNNPARREDATPKRVNALRNIVRNELGAFADWQRSREKSAGRPSDPKKFWQKANDVKHYFFSGMAAELRALGRRWDSKAIAALHDRLVSEPGRGNRLQRRDLVTAQRLRSNRYANSIDKALTDYGPRSLGSMATILSKEEAADVRGMMINEDHMAAKPELRTLASRLREISDGIWHDLRAAGFSLGYTRNGFLPRIYDIPKAEADMAGFLADAKEVYEAAGLEPDEARKAAAEWYYRLAQSSPAAFDQHQPSGDFLKGRALPPEADTIMAKWMVNEPIDLMRRYATGAAHRIEWAKRFGIDSQGLTDLFNQMASEHVDRRDIDTIRTMTDIMAGRNPIRHPNQTLNNLSSGVNTIYGTVALLGRAVFQHIAEPIWASAVLENPKYGLKAMIDALVGFVGTPSSKERREIADLIGLIDESDHNRVMADRFGGTYDDPANWQRIQAKLFYNTGLTALTKHKTAQSQGVINSYLTSLSKKLLRAKEGSTAAKEVLDRFNELGIRDPMPFAKWMIGLGGKLPSKDELAEGLDEKGNAPWAFDWITATKRLSSRITQEPHAMTKPLFSHTNIGRLMTGIQAFNYSFYDTIAKPMFKRASERLHDGRPGAATKGAAAAIAGMIMAYGGYFLSNTLKLYLTDRERWREEEANGTLLKYLAERTATTFFGNPLDPWVVQPITGLKYNRDLTADLPGPAAGNMMDDVGNVAKLFVNNSRKTNTAEHNALVGGYGLLVPWVAAGVGALPGGPIASGLEGTTQAYMTSRQGSQDAASAIVGLKNGRPNADGTKVKSGPTAYDKWLDENLGPVERKQRKPKNEF